MITIKFLASSNCKNWESGFKGTEIDNNKYCKIQKPKVCHQDMFNHIFDLSKHLNEDCKTMKNNSKDKFIDLLDNKGNTNWIGYPRTENWDYLNKGHSDYFPENVLKEIIDMNKVSEKDKKHIEVTVKFSEEGNLGNAKINLAKNEDLVKNRGSEYNNYNKKGFKPLAKNVFQLFIDSVSRVHFKRKLPKVYHWIENKYKSSNTNTDDDSNMNNSESFQFFKFHGTGTWTNVNMIPEMFGISLWDRQDGDYFLKYYKERGYVTGTTFNMCNRELIDLDNSMYNLKWNGGADHEFYSFFCDPNFTPYKHPHSIFSGAYSVRRKCLYNKSTAEWSIEYAKQFLEKYKDSPKFFRLGIIDGHEGSGEVVRYTDDDLYNFLVEFENNGHMKDTIMLIQSDHHFTLPGYYSIYEVEDWKQELTLPFLSFVIDKNLDEFKQIKENLESNEQAMVTPYDLHASLLSNFYKEDIYKSSTGQSLFLNKFALDGKNRSCQSLSIKKDWCRCSEDYQ